MDAIIYKTVYIFIKLFIDDRNGHFIDEKPSFEELEDPMRHLSLSEREHINNVMQRDAIVQQHLGNKIR